jgi:DNA replication protein DnaD
MLREQQDYKIRIDKYVWNALAMQMQCDADAAHRFVSDCINEFHLFESDGDFFWSNSLLKRMNAMDEKSEKARKAARARWKKTSKDAASEDSMQTQCECNTNADADAMQTQSNRNAINKMKVKENKISSSSSTRVRVIENTTKPEPKKSEEPIRESLYEAHIRVFGFGCNPRQAEILGSYIDDGMDESVVIRAIERAAAHGTGYSFGLIQKILNDYSAAQVKTIDQANAFDNEFDRRRAAKQSAKQRDKPRSVSDYARNPGDFEAPRAEGEGAISYGYFDQFPGLVKTVSDL